MEIAILLLSAVLGSAVLAATVAYIIMVLK
jgi:hypothetical protein